MTSTPSTDTPQGRFETNEAAGEIRTPAAPSAEARAPFDPDMPYATAAGWPVYDIEPIGFRGLLGLPDGSRCEFDWHHDGRTRTYHVRDEDLSLVNTPPPVSGGASTCDRPGQADAAVAEAFQARVQPWLMACFGPEISGDREERNHRFLEEALELVQSCGCTASEAHQLVDYTFARDVGEPRQETGGVMVTLAALCLANGLDMHDAAEVELARIWTKVDKIRAKQAAKPKHSPLPVVEEEEENPCADVLRGLASYLGVGGYNAATVDPREFDRKIRDGIDIVVTPFVRDAERYRKLRNTGAAPNGTLHLEQSLVFVGTNLDRFLDCALAGKPIAPSQAVEMDPTKWPELPKEWSPEAALRAAVPRELEGWRAGFQAARDLAEAVCVRREFGLREVHSPAQAADALADTIGRLSEMDLPAPPTAAPSKGMGNWEPVSRLAE